MPDAGSNMAAAQNLPCGQNLDLGQRVKRRRWLICCCGAIGYLPADDLAITSLNDWHPVHPGFLRPGNFHAEVGRGVKRRYGAGQFPDHLAAIGGALGLCGPASNRPRCDLAEFLAKAGHDLVDAELISPTPVLQFYGDG